MADAHPYIGKRVENEFGMVGVIFEVSDRCAFVSYTRYRPDDAPGMYWLTLPLTALEPVTPCSPAPPNPPGCGPALLAYPTLGL